jgi:hypothetical protein
LKQKYRILRTMATVFKVLAWLALIAGIIGSVTFWIQFSLLSEQIGTAVPAVAGFVVFAILFIYSLVSFGALYALAETINLLFDIERQTRAIGNQGQDQGLRPAA